MPLPKAERERLTERQREVLDFIQAKIQRDGYPPTIREIGDQLGIRSTNGVNDHLKALAKKGYLLRTEAKSRACVPTDSPVPDEKRLQRRYLGNSPRPPGRNANLAEAGATRDLEHSTAGAAARLSLQNAASAEASGMTFPGPSSRGANVRSLPTALSRGGQTHRQDVRDVQDGFDGLGRIKGEVELVDFPHNDDDELEVPVLGRIAAGQPILALEREEDTVRIDRMFLGKRNDRDVFALRVVGESMIEDGINDGDFIFVRKQREAARGAIVVALIDDEATVKRFYPEGDKIRFQPSNSTMKPIYVAAKDFKQTHILGVVVGIYRRMD